MHPTATLHSALQRSTLDFHRKIQARERSHDHYAMGEWEQQYQFDISGTIGTFPAEQKVQVLFQMKFLYDGGVVRGSQLSEPLFSHGVKLTSAPAGTVPYVYVSSWVQDSLFNYVGANVVVGVHSPAMGYGTAPASLVFKGNVHLRFQGFGAPIDPDDADDTAGVI